VTDIDEFLLRKVNSGDGWRSFFLGAEGAGEGAPPSRGAGEGAELEALVEEAALEGAGAGPESAAKAEAVVF
jgi:hypothetical protein